MLQSLHIQFIPLTTFTTCSRRGQIGGLIFSADWKLRVDHQIVRSNQNICSLNCVVTTCVKYAYEGFISTNIPPTTEFNVRDQEIRLRWFNIDEHSAHHRIQRTRSGNTSAVDTNRERRTQRRWRRKRTGTTRPFTRDGCTWVLW